MATADQVDSWSHCTRSLYVVPQSSIKLVDCGGAAFVRDGGVRPGRRHHRCRQPRHTQSPGRTASARYWGQVLLQAEVAPNCNTKYITIETKNCVAHLVEECHEQDAVVERIKYGDEICATVTDMICGAIGSISKREVRLKCLESPRNVHIALCNTCAPSIILYKINQFYFRPSARYHYLTQ